VATDARSGLVIYDTRQRRRVPFEPLESGRVRLYTCGPTVYADAHIGNLRAYVFEDLLRRTLRFFGYEVVQVMNLTDVDDKTIRESRKSGVSLADYTQPFIERFFRDLETLRIERAEHYPSATAHIPEMIGLIERLLDKGVAYIADGSVYYRVADFPDYGSLSGMNLERLARGVRIDADEYEEKGDFRDFALWKAWSPEDGDVVWDAPFGRGRPGWHIECSAMSMKYLGEEFDFHTGGVDNIFPHHENEIAQSVVATGKRFVRYWMHCAHLLVDGEKMAKSAGNFYTLSDLLARGHSPRALRWTLLSTHYRQTLNFTDTAVEASQAALARLDTLYSEALSSSGNAPVREGLRRALETCRERFSKALADDLNISGAQAGLFELVSEVHRIGQEAPISRAEGVAIQAQWEDLDRALGVLVPWVATLPREIESMVRERLDHRRQRRFSESDRLRKELLDQGYRIEDAGNRSVVIGKGGRVVIE